jgi:uncharacterized protein (TIGR02145 family)
MPNSIGLLYNGLGEVQSILPIQKPDDDSSYYLFTVGPHRILENFIFGLKYSIINMRLDNKFGDIESDQKNIAIPYGNNAYAGVTGTRHKNNKDVWVVVRLQDADSNYFASYKIAYTGLDTIPILSSSKIHYVQAVTETVPQMLLKITPDGQYLVSLHDIGTGYASDTVEFCYFNNVTGQITSLFTFLPGKYSLYPSKPRSAEFSLDSKYLYLSCINPLSTGNSVIYQYNLSSHDSSEIVLSETIIGYVTNNCGLQMGPDLKIYGTHPVADSLHMIDNPSSPGLGCNFIQNVISTQGRDPGVGLPQFIQRYYVYIRHLGKCLNDSVMFSTVHWPPADSLHWDFGDPASGPDNFSNLNIANHKYTAPGTYTTKLIVRHIDNRTDTAWQTITIYPSPAPALGPDRLICSGDSVILDADTCTGCTYQWDKLSTGQMNIGNQQTYTVHESGTYAVLVTGPKGCTGRDTVAIGLSPPPLLTTTPLSKSICSGESTNILLTSNVPAATFSWTATLTSGNITGFSADSGLVINQLLTDNLATSGIVTYHITPKMGNCIGDTSDYLVTVNPGDSVLVTITSSANNICAGTLVNFTAIPTNGGVTPSYQWNVNGLNVGTNQPTYAYNPASGDLVSCILTSSLATCTSNNPAASDTITMIVNPVLPVSVSILPSANPVCAGTSVTFTATPTNGGITPSYQWKVNGTNQGTNSSTFTYYPASGDLVSCILTSSEVCTSNNPASSNPVILLVNPVLPVSVTISASPNPVCSGLPVTFTATPVNGGTTPAYQWQLNGMNVGTNNPVYTYIPVTGDSIRCILTSNLPCVTNNPASGIWYHVSVIPSPVVTFTACFDTITATNAKPIKLKGGIPLGGTYSGPGITLGYFNPSLAGSGTKIITYTYTNVGLCTSSATARIFNFQFSIFNCGNLFTDIRDGRSYPTIQIGGQCWFAVNLDYGVAIPSNLHQRDNCIAEKYNNPASGIWYPASYQWDELMRYDPTPASQGLCPPSWHIPTEAEWSILFANWTNNAFAAAPLKYSGYSGFNALLNGASHLNWQWDYAGFATFYWSSDPHGPYRAWAHGMNDPDPSVSTYPSLRANAFSVRCIKD